MELISTYSNYSGGELGNFANINYKVTGLILSQIGQDLAAEAPISKNLLCKRVLNAWGIARMGARLERRLDEILAVGRFCREGVGVIS